MVNGIGEKCIEAMKAHASNLIEAHKRKMQEAYLQAEDGELKAKISFKVFPKGEGMITKTTIAYSVEKVSDSQEAFIQENQPALFPVNGKTAPNDK